MLKGYDLMWNRNFDGARESFLMAASMSPEQARPWEEMAEIAWQQKDVAAAALYEAHAATCDPKRATLWNTLGQYQIYAGLPSQAHGSFQQAIKLRPHWATAWLWDSVAFDKMKRPVEAEAAIRNSIRLNPRWPSSHLQLIRFLNAWRRFPELEVAVKDALRYCPNDAGNLEAAVNYYQSVKLRPNEAVHFAQRWVDVQPTSVAARERLILCLFSCKRNLEAQKQYKELERLRGQGKLKGDK
jgi:tetratricopeptide (TPR) repeat protein